MAALYIDLINRGKLTIDDVLPEWREEVEKALAEQNKPEPTEV